MITVEQAQQIISAQIRDFGTEQVGLEQSMGRILRENLYADRDLPPYNRVSMDGIAIRYEDFASGTRSFPIQGIAPAGSPQQELQQAAACLEVMTGSILPLGTDTVIRYEDLDISDQQARIQLDELRNKQNVHRKGMDRQKGELLAASGKKMSPAEVGLAATVGKAQLLVSRLPSVVVISTGDELVEVNQQPLPHQIRRSNIHRLVAGLKPFGIKAEQRHLKDDLEEVIEELSQLLEAFDVLILSGGVSKGKYDYVPEALDRLKVEKLFHRVKQRPGKPFWFGVAPSGARVFALPGNPVSSFMCSCRYMLPWLRASLGQHPVMRWKATLASDIHFKPDLTYFAQVKLSTNEQGVLEAEPIEGNGSGDLANLVEADGFLELPRGKDVYSKGETHSFWPYRM